MGRHREDFVGRSSELATLAAHVGDGRSPPRGPLLVAGEAGIGKSRLLAEFAVRAADAGWRTVWGRSWHELEAPPFWSWTQVVRDLRGLTAGTDLARALLDDAEEVERFELFDACADLILTAAADRPLLVLLDDLHVADLASLSLARFLADRVAGHRVALVGAYRSGGNARRPETRAHIEALARRGTELHLGPLGVDDVVRLVDDIDLAVELHRLTRGNPLFVEQVVRVRAAEASDPTRTGARPAFEVLRDAIAARVSSLPELHRRVLLAVSVLDQGASGDALVALLGTTRDELAGPLADLTDAGMVVGDGDETGPGLRPAHPVVAEVAQATAATSDRETMHLRAAELTGDDPDRAGELAHHLLRAGPAHARAAIDACIAAAAADAVAGDDAVAAHTRALDALDGAEDIDDRDRLRLTLLLELGRAQRRNDLPEAGETFDLAHELAVRLGDPEGLALAALRGGIQYYFRADVDGGSRSRLQEALEVLPAGDGVLRARILADLSAQQFRTDGVARSRRTAAEAVAAARRLGDPSALGTALMAQQMAHLGPATLTRRAATAREILALARRSDDPNLAVQGRFLLHNALLEQGDRRGLDQEEAVTSTGIGQIADRNHARFTMWAACTRALLAGDTARAEEVANRLLAQSVEAGEPYALQVFGLQTAATRWVQGRMLEMEPSFEHQARLAPAEPGWAAAVAYVQAADGRDDDARASLARMGDLDEITDGMHWLVTMAMAGEAAARAGDDQQAFDHWERLLPYAERFIPVNVGAAVWGTVARPLGLLALRLGHVDEGLGHLERAITLCARMDARPWLVEARLELAETLVRTGRDDGRSQQLAVDALVVSRDLDLTRFTQRAERLLDGTGSRGPTATEPSAEARPTVSVLGTFEVASSDGVVARWSSRKAREVLKILVARRGMPIHREVLMDLLWPGVGPDELANRLSVALSTVRRALDPGRRFGTNDLMAADRSSICLRLDRVDVDAERFLTAASGALAAHEADEPGADALLAESLAAHRGPAMPDEPYAEWAAPLQSEVRLVHERVLVAVAARAAASGDGLAAARAFQQLVEADPTDHAAHRGLLDALERIGATGLADAERRRFHRATASD